MSYFLKIDLTLGYHKPRVRGVDIPKTSVHARYSYYECLVISFGLTNAQTAFMYLMNRVFQNYLDALIIVFIDDIFIYSKSEDEHMIYLRIVLQVYKEYQLCAKYSNCEFCLRLVTFLGHILSSIGIDNYLMKMEVVKIVLDFLFPPMFKTFLV